MEQVKIDVSNLKRELFHCLHKPQRRLFAYRTRSNQTVYVSRRTGLRGASIVDKHGHVFHKRANYINFNYEVYDIL